MAMRSAARRLLADVATKTRVGPRRGFSSGGVLSEEEKAAENIYIKKMEKERAEKAARQGVNLEGGVSEATKATLSDTAKANPENKSKTIAVYAGIAGLIGLAYILTRKEPRRQEKDRE